MIAVDLRPERVELAKQLGAEDGVLATSAPEGALAFTNGKGVDCVFIAAAAKIDAPCQTAVEICRDRGRIVDVGAVQLNFPWNAMYLKEIQFYMARAYGPGSYDPAYEKQGHDYPFAYVRWTENRNMQEFVRLMSIDRVRVKPLITHQFPLEDASKAYETIIDPSSGSLAVLLQYPVSPDIADAPRSSPNAKLPPPEKLKTDRKLLAKPGWLCWERVIFRAGYTCQISKPSPKFVFAPFARPMARAPKGSRCVSKRITAARITTKF